MIAAAAFGASGYTVLLAESTIPVIEGDDLQADLRSTAFLRPARALFERIGIWDKLEPHATPLEALRIVDTKNTPPQIRSQRLFEDSENAAHPFGWNLLNWVTRRELLNIIEKMPNIEAKFGIGFKSIFTRTSEARVKLNDGTQVAAKLAIAADGRNSPLREALGISTQKTDYNQSSLAFTISHELPHHNISTEIYRDGGPFTLVPLQDLNGKHASAVVWMNRTSDSEALLSLDEDDFNLEMNARSAGILGQLKLLSHKNIFPIITQTATKLSSERAVVIAEAAHVLPPIGAQGLNTSLADINLLLDLCSAHKNDPGHETILDEYQRRRSRDISARSKAIDVFNRVTRSQNAILQEMRLLGLKAAHDITPLRKKLIRAGLGLQSEL